MKHILSHDFIHGVFHLDRGFFFTVKELLARPGHSIREYIEGRRVRHFNYFTLVIVIVTIEIILKELAPLKLSEVYEYMKESETLMYWFDKLSKDYPKLVIFATIPVYSAISWLVFLRARRTFAEHLVLNSYRAAGEMLLGIALIYAPMVFIDDPAIIRTCNAILTFAILLYSIIFYYQFFSIHNYSRKGLFFRSLLAGTAFFFIMTVVGVFVYILYKK